MDDFEKWWDGLLKRPGFPGSYSKKDACRAAYEAGQASRDEPWTTNQGRQISELSRALAEAGAAWHNYDSFAATIGAVHLALREALATYRAAVTKDDQKPSQEEG